ncbi:ATP-dependent DNA ligase [Tuberibacillus sp. Marseille-P3662]|uniref:ATP-dependent DNA ligase n=1 Tax=Tuberibacillus sp. Marseille-P3662 TaxID=1965358 RepID=UPI000A1CD483|nr:hypothetical protein [Tuberibacillus sp. Marseille-P3662]
MFIAPMLLETSEHAFDHSDYIFEPKFDGFRAIISVNQGMTTIYTRHQTVVTERFPELLNGSIADDVILDGEIVCYDQATQNVDFELVMNRFSTKHPEKVRRKSRSLPCSFIAFDILYYKGKDLRGLPLRERKTVLENVLADHAFIHQTPYVVGEGKKLFKTIQTANMEGICAKFSNSPYQSRRSPHWRKIINWRYTEVYLTGYLKAPAFGWLAAIKANNRLNPVGIIEHGPSRTERQAFYQATESLIKDEDNKSVHLKPAIRAKVKFRNWTRKSMLRSPVFEEFIL